MRWLVSICGSPEYMRSRPGALLRGPDRLTTASGGQASTEEAANTRHRSNLRVACAWLDQPDALHVVGAHPVGAHPGATGRNGRPGLAGCTAPLRHPTPSLAAPAVPLRRDFRQPRKACSRTLPRKIGASPPRPCPAPLRHRRQPHTRTQGLPTRPFACIVRTPYASVSMLCRPPPACPTPRSRTCSPRSIWASRNCATASSWARCIPAWKTVRAISRSWPRISPNVRLAASG